MNLQSLLWKKFTLALKDVYLIHSFMAFMALPNTYRLEKRPVVKTQKDTCN
jgi:hypothetical protein